MAATPPRPDAFFRRSSDTPEPRIVVLHGGPSAEREISLASGREVAAALERAGCRVTLLDPGATWPGDAGFLRLACWGRFDAAFVALHGTFGEDGRVQRLLARAGLRHTGSGAAASRVAFHKSAAKERFLADGVPTPDYQLLCDTDSPHQWTQSALRIGFPLVVKPDAQGSSLGVSLVKNENELLPAVERAFSFGRFAICERYVAGEEWTVGFLGERPLPPMRVSTSRDFLDFDAKYRDEATTVDFGETSPEQRKYDLVAAAEAARRTVGTAGVCRVDLRVDEAGRPWVLEVNTVPGLTPHSAVPTAAARAGLSFEELCLWSLHNAIEVAAGNRDSRPWAA